MSRWSLWATACATWVCLTLFACAAEIRVALVVGNGAYEQVAALPNPKNDAKEIASTLQKLGFEVTLLNDSRGENLRRGLSDFSNKALGADIGLIFYAGHGIEVDGENYLIPVDAKLETDLRIRYEAVPLSDVLASLGGVKGIRIVMLDACRNNPFISSMKVTTAKRTLSRGLSRVEPSVGTLVSFAAKEGTTAADGESAHSPYTIAVLKNLNLPGIELNKMFRQVRDEVLEATKGKQEPYTYGSTSSEDVFLNLTAKKQVEPVTIPNNQIFVDFNLAKEFGSVGSWKLFLQKHGHLKNDLYVGLANIALESLAQPKIKASTEEMKLPSAVERPVNASLEAAPSKQENLVAKKPKTPAVKTPIIPKKIVKVTSREKQNAAPKKPVPVKPKLGAVQRGPKPNPMQYSFKIWGDIFFSDKPKIANTPYGRLSCAHPIKGQGPKERECYWIK